jgi:hypothetical protein
MLVVFDSTSEPCVLTAIGKKKKIKSINILFLISDKEGKGVWEANAGARSSSSGTDFNALQSLCRDSLSFYEGREREREKEQN